MVRLLATLSFALLSAFGAPAQCLSVTPPTGCPGSLSPWCATQPRIGTRLVAYCPPRTGLGVQFTIVGHVGAAVSLLPPIACGAAACILRCTPVVVLPQAGALVLDIPNHPNLLGVLLCMQCGQLESQPCATLTQALGITVQ